MRTLTHVRRACSWRRILKRQKKLLRVNEMVGCQDWSAQTGQGNSSQRVWGVCLCWVQRVIPVFCQPRTTERSSGMGGEPECCDCNSIQCLAAAVWVRVCMHVFFQGTMSPFVFITTALRNHTHTPLTNNSPLVWVCREACVVTYVWYFARLCCPWRQAVTVQQSVQIGSAPCTSAFSLDAKTLLDSRRDWVWWCRQRANSSSQWDNRLLLLHLCWRPDWAYWKVRCREGQKGEI